MTAGLADIPVLETERLTLTPVRPTDLQSYLAFNEVSDLSVGKYRGGRPTNEVEAIVDVEVAHWKHKAFGMFMLRRKADSAVVGGTGIVHPDDWPSHELTWWLLPSARRAGLATEASRRVINWAYDQLGWNRVETHMRDENAPARRLAERLGGTLVRRDVFPDNVARDVFLLPRQSMA